MSFFFFFDKCFAKENRRCTICNVLDNLTHQLELKIFSYTNVYYVYKIYMNMPLTAAKWPERML